MENEATRFFMMSEEEVHSVVKAAASTAAEKAIEVYNRQKEEQKEAVRDRRLRNTHLLLKNYRMFKQSSEESVFSLAHMETEESAADIIESMMNIYDDEVIVDSIKRSAARTAVIVAHVDNMLLLYETYCRHTCGDYVAVRRYEVMYDAYIAEVPLSKKELAEKYNVSKDTIYMDLREAKKNLAALIFGVDGFVFR